MTKIEQAEIRVLPLEELDSVSGGSVVDTIVNVAKDICHAVNPPTAPIDPPSIPQIGHAIGSVLNSIF
ncbi:MAG TPA: hypothetical protein VGM09_04250 [Bradyrhizobium sp.]|jgi:hypothetical protein